MASKSTFCDRITGDVIDFENTTEMYHELPAPELAFRRLGLKQCVAQDSQNHKFLVVVHHEFASFQHN